MQSSHEKRNTDFQICAANRHSWLFPVNVETAG